MSFSLKLLYTFLLLQNWSLLAISLSMSINYIKNATSFMNLLLDSDNNLSLDNLESQSSLGSVIHLVALRQTASHLTMLHLVRGFKVSIEYLSKGLT